MSQPIYFIQGIFFQDNQWLTVAYESEGAIAVIRSGLCRFMFSGVIELDPEAVLGTYIGRINDSFGEAELTNIQLSETRLHFTKKYGKRTDTIEYNFRRQDDGAWCGEYDGEQSGRGSARCMLTPVPVSLFAPTTVPS